MENLEAGTRCYNSKKFSYENFRKNFKEIWLGLIDIYG